MNKEKVVQHLIEALKQRYKTAVDAAELAHQTATHKESIAKTKYDTFGLEASYLAHGQSKRVEALERSLEAFQSLPAIEWDEDVEIGVSALVTLEAQDGDRRHLLIGPAEGGLKTVVDDEEIVVVTGDAPLGKKLVGKMIGDEIVFFVDQQVKSFEIIDVK